MSWGEASDSSYNSFQSQVNQIPFSFISRKVLRDLAQFLDIGDEHGCTMLAEKMKVLPPVIVVCMLSVCSHNFCENTATLCFNPLTAVIRDPDENFL